MNAHPRPFSAEHPSTLALPPARPFRVAILGAGKVGTSYARALERAGHAIVAELHRDDDPSIVSEANVVVIAVPDDALGEAAGVVERCASHGTVVLHTCGLAGLEPLRACGPLIAAIHPAAPVARHGQSLDGVCFGVTCDEELRAWSEMFVRDLGGEPKYFDDEQRALYHAALVMASNFAVSLAGDSAEILHGHEILMPLLRQTVENIGALGPDAALTGPVVRGDVGTVRAHLAALPEHLRDVYVANARRALARAVASGRLDPMRARRMEDALR